MRISIKELTTDIKWRVSIGLSQKQFLKLLDLFKEEYINIYGGRLEDRNKKNLSVKNILIIEKE
ncbi:MAG: hypothetical protein KatS3mg068_0748 [Candidatus Sericytochromatia bacterium]|nr:MAG: hypothetical protein KatS3mg068_0748 [Candidatus Sericytochromatia bacterium]